MKGIRVPNVIYCKIQTVHIIHKDSVTSMIIVHHKLVCLWIWTKTIGVKVCVNSWLSQYMSPQWTSELSGSVCWDWLCPFFSEEFREKDKVVIISFTVNAESFMVMLLSYCTLPVVDDGFWPELTLVYWFFCSVWCHTARNLYQAW